MKFLKPLLLTFSLLLIGQLYAQDVPHYTLFDYAPLSTNPALTGAYSGSVRLGGLFRDQGFNKVPNEYLTYSFYVDAPIIRGFGKKDWIGVGLNIFQDKSGAAALQTGGGLFSAAYHLAMNKKGTSVLTFGVQGGMTNRKIDISNVDFGDELEDTSIRSADRNMFDTDGNGSENFLNINAGILLTAQASKQTRLQFGLAAKNILTPDYSFLNTKAQQDANPDSISIDLPLRITFHGNFAFDLNKKWTLSPTFLVNFIRTHSPQAALQTWLDYKLKPEQDLKLRFGLGYRVGDAAEALLGIDIKDLRFGLGYDITLSDLSRVNKTVGGIEIAASYIIKIYKEPVIDPVIICPKF